MVRLGQGFLKTLYETQSDENVSLPSDDAMVLRDRVSGNGESNRIKINCQVLVSGQGSADNWVMFKVLKSLTR